MRQSRPSNASFGRGQQQFDYHSAQGNGDLQGDYGPQRSYFPQPSAPSAPTPQHFLQGRPTNGVQTTYCQPQCSPTGLAYGPSHIPHLSLGNTQQLYDMVLPTDRLFHAANLTPLPCLASFIHQITEAYGTHPSCRKPHVTSMPCLFRSFRSLNHKRLMALLPSSPLFILPLSISPLSFSLSQSSHVDRPIDAANNLGLHHSGFTTCPPSGCSHLLLGMATEALAHS
ncbi:hypothetical protein EV702DRAFT_1131357, partial [Suillus placidus]